MGILKKDYRIQTNLGLKASPVQYWNYAGVKSFEILPNNQKGVVVLFNGYTSQEQRAAAKANGYLPDHVYEFLICNWSRKFTECRSATIEEKKAAYPQFDKPLKDGGKPKKFWEELEHEIVIGERVEHYMDYDKFMAAYNKENEGVVAYEIMKQHMHSAEFFEGSIDV